MLLECLTEEFQLKHYSFVDLKFEQYGFAGVKIEVKCLKNKLFTPNIPVTMIVGFQRGINNFFTNFNFLVDCKRLKSGAWNSLVALPEVKFRTKDAPQIYKENEQFRKAFDDQLQEALKIEIIDKYKPED